MVIIMDNKSIKQKEFLERMMQKNFINKEKQFLNKDDFLKTGLRFYRDDLFSFPIMSEEVREERHEKLFDLCSHFATSEKNNTPEIIFSFWPKYFNQFMTPKLFDLIPNEWFTSEIGFCFACKHFKGHKKGHHRLFHSLSKRKVINLFGKCAKYNPRKVEKLYSVSFRFNNHVMTNFRCKGWEPSKFYTQLLKHRLYLLLTDKKNNYTLEQFNAEQDKVNIYSFLSGNEEFY
jgi:hypothetical protein